MARDQELPVDLAKELERLSRYEHLSGKSNPVILRHLEISTRSGNYHILSRLRDSETDYSKRNNHIAHHLAFSQDEAINLPDPATLLLYWKGWKDAWLEPPRILNERDQFSIHDLDTIPDTGDLEFESAVVDGRPRDHAFTIEEGQERSLARHFRKELLSLPVLERWNTTFTNFILTSDRPTLFVWRGNWHGRPLPYDFTTRPSSSNRSAATRVDEPSVPTPEAPRFANTAPTVEIPEDLSTIRRRRRKRSWTRKRFSNLLNLSLVGLTLLCLGIVVYLLLDIKAPSSTTAPSPVDASVSNDSSPVFPVDSQTSLKERWDGLHQSNQLLEKIDEGVRIATSLAQEGDTQPLLIAEFLIKVRSVKAHTRNEELPIISIPKELIRSENGQWSLDPIVARELETQEFAVLPNKLTAMLEGSLSENSLYFPLQDRFSSNRFIPEDVEIGLKAIRRSIKDVFGQNGLEAVAAAEAYEEIWSKIANDETLKNLADLENVFGIEPSEQFFAIDEDGRLLTPNYSDIIEHITQLYEQFLLPQYSSFEITPDFRQALNLANQSHENAISVARAIFQVLSTANAHTASLRNQVDAILAQWRKTFIRGDLMEETMINFNLERLSNSKRTLATLQSQFTPGTLNALDSLEVTLNSLDNAEASLKAIDSATNWGLLYLANPPR